MASHSDPPTSPAIATFVVRRDDLRKTRVLAHPPVAPSGERPHATLRVEKFALTSNTLSYGLLGESSSYFDFFPLAESGWGCIPAWGMSTVVSSAVEGLEVGARFFGYVPMATHFTVEPAKVTESFFLDGAAHRPTITPIYSTYHRRAADTTVAHHTEAADLVFRPLFSSSFILADFLADKRYFGAERVVFSSASSKIAYGAAYLLSAHGDVEVVGLTAEKNRGFVESLGVYDRVLPYGEPSLPTGLTVYVDLAGDPAVRASMRRALGKRLVHDCQFGSTHWDRIDRRNLGAEADPEFEGAPPERFSTVAQIRKRNDDWGPEELRSRLNDALGAFVARATAGEKPWVRFVTASGAETVSRIYDAMIHGRASPSDGNILAL